MFVNIALTEFMSGADFIIIDTLTRPHSDDLKELAKGWHLRILGVPPLSAGGDETMRQALEAGDVPVFETLTRLTVGY